MAGAAHERRHPGVNPSEPAAACFGDRRLQYRHQVLRTGWTSCPSCGGHVLHRPTAALRREVPDADGSCGTCGAPLMGMPDGSARVLKPRRLERVLAGNASGQILH